MAGIIKGLKLLEIDPSTDVILPTAGTVTVIWNAGEVLVILTSTSK